MASSTREWPGFNRGLPTPESEEPVYIISIIGPAYLRPVLKGCGLSTDWILPRPVPPGSFPGRKANGMGSQLIAIEDGTTHALVECVPQPFSP